MNRLTEEKQIGPWASLKNKAEAKVGAFNDYECLMAHMEAVTRLKYYEDLEEQGRLAVVVRCKDCKWFFQDADNEPCCRNVCGLVIVTDEDFCSLGERREDK